MGHREPHDPLKSGNAPVSTLSLRQTASFRPPLEGGLFLAVPTARCLGLLDPVHSVQMLGAETPCPADSTLCEEKTPLAV